MSFNFYLINLQPKNISFAKNLFQYSQSHQYDKNFFSIHIFPKLPRGIVTRKKKY
ncbi:MAG: hypothetical protein ACI83B_002003 [Sediminicola sp.]|jgi:hypothetical protein